MTTEVSLADGALELLRREAVKYRVSTYSSFLEDTPEGLWRADERRYADDLLRKVDRIQYEFERDFLRHLDWEILHGPGTSPPPRKVEADDAWTPERFYRVELAPL